MLVAVERGFYNYEMISAERHGDGLSARHVRRFRLMVSRKVRLPQVSLVAPSGNVVLCLAESGVVGS
jgi:hypothetical protein